MSAKNLRHKFVSGIADLPDPTQVRPSNWNDDHVLWFGIEPQTATTYTFNDDDHLTFVSFSNLATINATLPKAGASALFISGWMCFVRNLLPGAVIITPTGCTIDALPNITVRAGQSLLIFSDGANYFTMPMVGPASGTFVTSLGAATTAVDIGAAAAPFGNAFFKTGGVLNFGSDVTLTHTVNALTIDGGDVQLNGSLFINGGISFGAATVNGILDINGPTLTHDLVSDVPVGPKWTITHDRPAGAISDILHSVDVKGRDGAGNMFSFGGHEYVLESNVVGTSYGLQRWYVLVNNIPTVKLILSGQAAAFAPATDAGLNLGYPGLGWANFWMGSGTQINFGNGSSTIVHTAGTPGTLTFNTNVTFTSPIALNNQLSLTGTLSVNSQYIFHSTSNDTSAGTVLWTAHYRPVGVTGDAIWLVQNNAHDNTGALQQYTQFESIITSAVAGAEGGGFRWQVADPAAAGSMAAKLLLSPLALSPATNGAIGLGTSSLGWKDLWFNAGAIITWAGSDGTLTHTADLLTLNGMNFKFNNNVEVAGTFTLASLTVPGATIFNGTVDVNGAMTVTSSPTNINITNGTPSGAQIIVQHLKTVAGASDDIIYKVDAWGRDSASQMHLYARTEMGVFDPTNNLERGFVRWSLATNGGIVPTMILSPHNLMPLTDALVDLGVVSLGWKNLFLSANAKINFGAAADVYVQHSNDTLSFVGAGAGYRFDNSVVPTAAAAVTLGSQALPWNRLYLGSSGRIDFGTTVSETAIIGGADMMSFLGASSGGYRFDYNVAPYSDGDGSLGMSGAAWQNLWLTAASSIFFASDVLITHATGMLSFTGAENGYRFAGAQISPTVQGGSDLGTAALAWGGLYLASSGIINFGSDIQLSHSTDQLLMTGGNFNVSGEIILTGAIRQSVANGTTLGCIINSTFAKTGNGVSGDIALYHEVYGKSTTGVSRNIGLLECIVETATNANEDGSWRWRVFSGGALRSKMILSGFQSALMPAASSGVSGLSLGTAANAWTDAFIAAAGTLNFGNSDVIVTHTTNKLIVSGGVLDTTGQNITVNGSDIVLTSGSGNIMTVGSIYVDGTQVLSNRKIGWALTGGTLSRVTFSAYGAPTFAASYNQAQVQALGNHVEVLSQHLCAVINDLMSHGIFGVTTTFADFLDDLPEHKAKILEKMAA